MRVNRGCPPFPVHVSNRRIVWRACPALPDRQPGIVLLAFFLEHGLEVRQPSRGAVRGHGTEDRALFERGRGINFVFEGRTYYYFADKGRARSEAQNFRN